MNAADAALIEEWLSEWASEDPIYGPATRFLEGLIDSQPERAWTFIQTLVDQGSDVSLNWIAAGPLEDFLCAHGSVFIDRVERRALESDRFKKCLRGVWGQNRMAPPIYARLRTAAGA